MALFNMYFTVNITEILIHVYYCIGVEIFASSNFFDMIRNVWQFFSAFVIRFKKWIGRMKEGFHVNYCNNLNVKQRAGGNNNDQEMKL